MADRNGSKNVNRPIRRAFMESPSRHAVLLGEEVAEIVTEFMHSPLGDEITVDPNPVGDAVANAQPPELAQTDADQKDEEIYVAVFSALKECVSDVRPHLSDDQITAMISSDQIAAQYNDDEIAARYGGHVDLQRRVEMALHLMVCADCAIREHSIRNGRYGH